MDRRTADGSDSSSSSSSENCSSGGNDGVGVCMWNVLKHRLINAFAQGAHCNSFCAHIVEDSNSS